MSKILNKLSKLMLNSDDKEILIKEYTELKTRYNRLQKMLNKLGMKENLILLLLVLENCIICNLEL